MPEELERRWVWTTKVRQNTTISIYHPNESLTRSSRPEEPENTDALSYQRRIGYYELFSVANGCNVKRPGDLVVDPLTHLNLAFVNFGADFRLIDDYPDLVSEAAFLKVAQTGLRINIAIGGWAFNDPPTASRFSESKMRTPFL